MDKKLLDVVLDNLEKLNERANKSDVVLAEIKSDLKEHMRRSLANEQANELTKKALEVHMTESNARLSKLETLKEKFAFVGWLLAGTVGLVETAVKVLSVFHVTK